MSTPLFDPSSVAVVCVECQNGVLGPDSVLPALATDSTDLVGNIRRLLDSAREFGVRVVHATFEGNLGGRPTGTARLWRALGPATADWKPGASVTSVVSELLAPTDLVLPRHHGLFPTSGSELLPVLKGLGVTTIVLTGVSLNLAITHTAGDATQAGFHLVVPRDAVGGTPASYAQQVLDNTIAVLGRLTTVDQLIQEWSGSDRIEP
ncbi:MULTISPECIES: cysteine hydrolase [Mycolicibacterium]|jgi:nicotinamidase-related amidase|uniref:Cysteine hydrolase n=3 Tax=Mycolicibacterium TaxID=1866885 RepID=A0A378WEW7_MYCFO|nr:MULTISPECIES: cysteine hydrolase [Mycolicibacterium]MCV7142385.1 cysteine hydrolase [Mycolicibacterium fortuitum]MDV7194567.1 cysteine hydrolase [Mycolicibacterium fortuitum]MDV7208129.1 cysteine hydrolase [Mycolicibacterium fortuitum]MDV7230023.1 cysteine hydrolase [Mycolicibacterium fortuitum]MDV7261828.1 cysteine hydrolase [Mycolicibacterium fortuitum]